ncbi:MAG: alpha-ribazole phosphatase [Desulfuromonas sp.]|nr:MAG: alpha-ribazole phosphatase [Desulfuromonas sp.]
MKRTRIHLIRHGEVEGHEEKRYNGQADVSVTPKGNAQLGMLQLRMQKLPISAVYSSDLGRCLDGARILAAGYGLETVTEKNLRELDAGEWERLTWDEIQKKYPKEWQARLKDIVNVPMPGGENLNDLAGRVRPVIKKIVKKYMGEEVIVVAHGGVNRVILLDAIGAPLESLFAIEQDFGCLNSIDYYEDGNSVVRLLNG